MMKQNYLNSRDGGISESIGFLIIFTIIITGIGLVTLYGYPMLLQQQTGADEQIMEKNMIVLQNDFKSLAYKTVPYTETSLKIGGGSLTVNRFQTTGPTLQIQDGSYTDLIIPQNTGDLRYQSSSSQQEISLQNGAVIKRDLSGSGSVMLAEPRWFYDDQTKTMVINVVYVNSSGIMSREGIGTVQMKLGETDYVPPNTPSGNMVVIKYTWDTGQDYSTAWKNYLEKTMKMTCTVGATDMTCSRSGVQTIVIKKTEVFINTL